MIFLAWHIAALMRQQKLPRLDSLLLKQGAAGKRRTQTPEERWQMLRAEAVNRIH
jgi:hypothetical protein